MSIGLEISDKPIQHDFAKRLFDIIFSLCALIGGVVIYLVIAIAVKLSSRGPIFYGQKRVGRGGKEFKCWKFRTMHVNAERRLLEILRRDPALREEWEKYYKLKKDPRITKIGDLLRKTSLDELPQFWNVLKGDLSVVGPRPLCQEEVDKYLKEKSAKILSVRPGLTGVWQTSGRNLVTYEERVKLEESYIDNRSFLFDLGLICKTIPAMIFRKGAY